MEFDTLNMFLKQAFEQRKRMMFLSNQQDQLDQPMICTPKKLHENASIKESEATTSNEAKKVEEEEKIEEEDKVEEHEEANNQNEENPNRSGLSLKNEASLLRKAIERPSKEGTPEVNEKKVPVFVICSQLRPPEAFEAKFTAATLADVLVELPANLPFENMVQHVVKQLGLDKEDHSFTQGELVVSNWKPIDVEHICHNDPTKSVADVLQQLSSVPTLKLTFQRRKESAQLPPEPMLSLGKDRMMAILLENIYKDQLKVKAPIGVEDVSTKLAPFTAASRWGSAFANSPFSPSQNIHPTAYNLPRSSSTFALGAQEKQSCGLFPGAPAHFGGYGSLGIPSSTMTSAAAPGSGSVDQYHISKPRMRVCFDPETELPKLQKWFSENNHPTRQQVEDYVKELNSLESRKGRRPLDVNNVIYWFKNTRAAVKRAEMKARASVGPSLEPRKTPTAPPGGPNFWSWFGNPNNNPTVSPFSALSSPVDAKRSDSSSGSVKEEDNDVVIEDNDSSIMTTSGGEVNNIQDLEANASYSSDDQRRSTPPPSMVPPSLMNPQMMNYMNYIGPFFSDPGNPPMSALMDAEKRKRNRTFIDPVSEVPRLEEWFNLNTHPSHGLIARYTDQLNELPYRQKFPKLEQKNIQFWFKNRRAKTKRLHNCI